MPQRKRRKKIGEILVEMDVVTAVDIKTALKRQKREDGLIGEILIRMGVATENDISRALDIQESLDTENGGRALAGAEREPIGESDELKDSLAVNDADDQGSTLSDPVGGPVIEKTQSATPPRKRLGEILVDMGLVTDDQVSAALKVQKKEGGLLGSVLIKLQFVAESDIAIALAKQNAIPYLPAHQCEVNPSALKLVDQDFAEKNSCLPLDRVGNILIVICPDPTQHYMIADLEALTQCRVQACIGLEGEIQQGIRKWYKIKTPNKLLDPVTDEEKDSDG